MTTTCLRPMHKSLSNPIPKVILDGTFLKGICKGMMLVALGQDFMNSFYPLAWTIRSLDLKDGAKITFISAYAKDVVDKVLPEAQHRYCVRHIKSN
ncbi:hypothetical protein H5410_038220 [Solanum commersonii]|uniref:MULE transposase domain-containing protein n=1 Tax=Solanum commersonii TaxID=4109 RepID=A0A9J5YCH5_SOLCO|nr:hypothetical protein H5410_038220 [Solanum commersonii]